MGPENETPSETLHVGVSAGRDHVSPPGWTPPPDVERLIRETGRLSASPAAEPERPNLHVKDLDTARRHLAELYSVIEERRLDPAIAIQALRAMAVTQQWGNG